MAQAPGVAAVLCAAAAQCLGIAQALACDEGLPGAHRVESSLYSVTFRMQPPELLPSRHFSIEVAVCAKAGAPAPDAVRVDARMPEHGHGMNYKVDVKPLGGGRFQADGLLFHMPGRWEIVFDVRSGEASDRITHDLVL